MPARAAVEQRHRVQYGVRPAAIAFAPWAISLTADDGWTPSVAALAPVGATVTASARRDDRIVVRTEPDRSHARPLAALAAPVVDDPLGPLWLALRRLRDGDGREVDGEAGSGAGVGVVAGDRPCGVDLFVHHDAWGGGEAAAAALLVATVYALCPLWRVRPEAGRVAACARAGGIGDAAVAVLAESAEGAIWADGAIVALPAALVLVYGEERRPESAAGDPLVWALGPYGAEDAQRRAALGTAAAALGAERREHVDEAGLRRIRAHLRPSEYASAAALLTQRRLGLAAAAAAAAGDWEALGRAMHEARPSASGSESARRAAESAAAAPGCVGARASGGRGWIALVRRRALPHFLASVRVAHPTQHLLPFRPAGPVRLIGGTAIAPPPRRARALPPFDPASGALLPERRRDAADAADAADGQRVEANAGDAELEASQVGGPEASEIGGPEASKIGGPEANGAPPVAGT